MSHATSRSATATSPSSDPLPAEILELKERIEAQPFDVRTELNPLVEEVLEHARFRSRVLTVARDALERLRLDLEMARFDLDATRKERERLLRLLQGKD